MNHLIRARFINFQSHKDTTIEFHEGVNAIIGNSGSGKSALMRGLNWVFTNRPSGEAFQSHWGGDTRVETEWEDGTIVVRGRDKQGNYYRLNDQEFRAFGAGDPPQEIVAALNLNEINYQGQLDAPFLLSSSPGEVAQTLNKIVDLSVIDRTMSAIQAEKYRCDNLLKSSTAEVESLTRQLANLQFIDGLEAGVANLEWLEKGRDDEDASRTSLIRFVAQIESVTNRGQHLRRILTANEKVQTALTCIKDRKKLVDEIQSIRGLVRKIEVNRKDTEDVGAILNAEPKINAGLAALNDKRKLQSEMVNLNTIVNKIERSEKALTRIRPLLSAEKKITEAFEIIRKADEEDASVLALRKAITNVETLRGRAEAASKLLLQHTAKFKEIMPNVCPLCGRS